MMPFWSLRRAAASGASVDVAAPAFAGATSLVGVDDSTVTVYWDAAADGNTSSSAIVYTVYIATSSGGQNLNSADATVIGDTSATLNGLSQDTTYYAVVRARDAAGNRDTNTVEVSGQTFSSGRKARNRRRARAGTIGTADVSVGDGRRAPYRLRTRTR